MAELQLVEATAKLYELGWFASPVTLDELVVNSAQVIIVALKSGIFEANLSQLVRGVLRRLHVLALELLHTRTHLVQFKIEPFVLAL